MENRLNILYVISALEGATGPVKTLSLLALAMAKRGHKVCIAFYKGEKDEGARLLQDQNIEVFDLRPVIKGNTFSGRINLAFQIKKIIRDQRINVVHAHSYDADWYSALAVKLSKKVSLLVTVHSLSYFHWIARQRWRYKLLIVPTTDRFICVCHYLNREFQKNFKIDKSQVIHNAPPQEFYAPVNQQKRKSIRLAYKIANNDLVLGVIGNFSWVKGIDSFVEALALLDFKSFKAFLIGGWYGRKEEELKNYLEQKGLEENVIFTGPQNDIPSYLDAIDVFVLPSVEEADPWVLSEAMAKGKPVIATNVGGIPEKLIDKQNGLLVASRDPGALTQAIERYHTRSDEMKLMGMSAQNHMAAEFPFEQMIDQHEQAYIQR